MEVMTLVVGEAVLGGLKLGCVPSPWIMISKQSLMTEPAAHLAKSSSISHLSHVLGIWKPTDMITVAGHLPHSPQTFPVCSPPSQLNQTASHIHRSPKV